MIDSFLFILFSLMSKAVTDCENGALFSATYDQMWYFISKKNRINLLLIEYDGRVNDNILVDRQPAWCLAPI